MTPYCEGSKAANRVVWSAVTVSVAANGIGGYAADSDVDPVVSAGVHGAIPLLTVLTKWLLVKTVDSGFRRIDGFCYLVAISVGFATVALSVTNLAHLAEMIGLKGPLKWVFAGAIEGLALAASVKAVALAVAKVRYLATSSKVEPSPEAVPAVVIEPAVTTPEPVIDHSSKPTPKPKPKPKPTSTAKSKLDVAAVADVLALDPTITAQVLAERFGVSKRTIQRTAAWQNRNDEQNNNEENEEVTNKIEIEKSEVAV